MARKKEIREIGEHRFRATQMKVRKANTVLERLIKIFGEALGELVENVGSGDTESADALVGDLKRGALSGAAQKLVSSLSGEELNWLVDSLRPTVEFQPPSDGESSMWVPITADHWDDVFAGAILDQFKLLIWVLELNYASFFAEAGGLAGAARRFVTPTRSSSSSPKTPTPGSGESSSPSG